MSSSAAIATCLREELRGQVSDATSIRLNEPMARRTTLRVGGPADFFIEPANEEDLATVLKCCRAMGLSIFMLGRGSNLLVRDGGIRGAVISLGEGEFSRVKVDGETL